jgi:hypothetical protein
LTVTQQISGQSGLGRWNDSNHSHFMNLPDETNAVHVHGADVDIGINAADAEAVQSLLTLQFAR